MIQSINDYSGKTGITAAYNDNNTGILLTDNDGDTITLLRTDTTADTWSAVVKDDQTAVPDTLANEIGSPGFGAASFRGHVLLESENIFSIDNTSGAGQNATAAKASLSQISTINMESQTGASDAISVIDKAITSIDTIRGRLGAAQNRFTATISNLTNVSTNVAASRSRILDADLTAETSILSQNQIIQQAGIAMLTQANQLPQSALSLLK
jgi:flagellin